MDNIDQVVQDAYNDFIFLDTFTTDCAVRGVNFKHIQPSDPVIVNPPSLKIRHANLAPRSRLAFAQPAQNRISVTVYPGIKLVDIQETVLHELVHIFIGRYLICNEKPHGPLFHKVLEAAFVEAFPKAVKHLKGQMRASLGRYSQALHYLQLEESGADLDAKLDDVLTNMVTVEANGIVRTEYPLDFDVDQDKVVAATATQSSSGGQRSRTAAVDNRVIEMMSQGPQQEWSIRDFEGQEGITESGNPMTYAEAKTSLWRLTNAGRVIKPRRGVYSIAP